MLRQVKISIVSFFLAIVMNYTLPLKYGELFSISFNTLSLQTLALPLKCKLVEIFLLLPMSKENKLHSFTAYCLGFVFLLGLKNLPTSYGIYLMVLASFHFSEYVATGVGNPQNLSWDSFLVNHSVPYWVAMVASWSEHLAWAWATPDVHVSPLGGAVTRLGVAVCLLGEAVRKMAMLQAGRNFNHLVQSQKADDHELVTWGVYSVCRHPSYVGWFFWSVGTQLVLLNPVCFLLYAYVSFSFFSERIYVEEYTLISFFGQEYRDYQARVGTGIPGIRGYEGPPVWGDARAGKTRQD